MLKRISLFFILFNFIVCPFTLQSEDIMDIVAAYDGVYTAVSLSGILLFPIADFGEFYDFGTGSGLDVSIHNIISKNITCIISTNAYTFNSLDQGRESLFTLLLAIHGGYTIEIDDNYWISPFLGFGYLLHMVSIAGKKEYFFNPAIIIKCYLDYEINDQIHVFLVPGYNIYFETNNVGQFLNMETGIKFPL